MEAVDTFDIIVSTPAALASVLATHLNGGTIL
jgi:hypothetical protein